MTPASLWEPLPLQRQAASLRQSTLRNHRVGEVGHQDQDDQLSWLEEVRVCSDVNTWESWMLLISGRAKSCVTSLAWPRDRSPGTIPEAETFLQELFPETLSLPGFPVWVTAQAFPQH